MMIDEVQDSDNDTNCIELVSSNTLPVHEQQFDFKDLIINGKKTTLLSKSSTKNNDILQKYVVADI